MGREGVECSHVARNTRSFVPLSSEHNSNYSVPITATTAWLHDHFCAVSWFVG